MGQINAYSFRLDTLEPINSFDVHGNHLIVTIGRAGLGYVDLSNFKDSRQVIPLSTLPALDNLTLDNTNYLRVLFNHKQTNETNLQVLVTTSNSYSYILDLILNKDKISFQKVAESFSTYVQ